MAIMTNSFQHALQQACYDFSSAVNTSDAFYYRYHIWKSVFDVSNRCIHVFPLDGSAGSVCYCW